MKRYYSLLLLIMMAVVTLGLTACGSDDNDEPEGGDIVGTWSSDLSKEIVEAMSDFYSSGEELIQYRSDGTFVSVFAYTLKPEWAELFDDDEDHVVEVERGKYTTNGNKITLVYSDGKKEIDTFSVKGNTLTMTTTAGIIITATFTRVSDSEIEKYLN